MLAAGDLATGQQLNFCDAVILSAATELAAGFFCSEDLQENFTCKGLGD